MRALTRCCTSGNVRAPVLRAGGGEADWEVRRRFAWARWMRSRLHPFRVRRGFGGGALFLSAYKVLLCP